MKDTNLIKRNVKFVAFSSLGCELVTEFKLETVKSVLVTVGDTIFTLNLNSFL